MENSRVSPTIPIACVIPTHARPDLLAEALLSIGRQTVAPAEIVVVSDIVGQHAAQQVVEEFRQNTGLAVTYLDGVQGVGGASSSRNRGAAATSAPLLAFLDDDDWWEPAYLQRAMEIHTGTGADLVVTWLDVVSGEMRRPGLNPRAGQTADDAAVFNGGVTGTNFIVTRSAFDALGGFDPGLPVKNDTDFFYRFLRAGYRYEINSDRLAVMRKHASGQLMALDERRANGTLAYLEKHRAILRPRDIRYLEASAMTIRGAAESSLVRKIGYFMRAILHYPRGARRVLWTMHGLVSRRAGRLRNVASGVGTSNHG